MKVLLTVGLTFVFVLNSILVPIAHAQATTSSAVPVNITSVVTSSTYRIIEESLARDGTVLIDPRIAWSGKVGNDDIHVLQFGTNNSTMPTVLMVIDASGHIRNAVAVHQDTILPDPNEPAIMGDNASSIAVTNLLTGEVQQFVLPPPNGEQSVDSGLPILLVMRAIYVFTGLIVIDEVWTLFGLKKIAQHVVSTLWVLIVMVPVYLEAIRDRGWELRADFQVTTVDHGIVYLTP